ncbi:MAG: hypothetical protein H0Z24_05455 [Thermosipho sp. (in: Bacteria)]|nr:hypothetical protein [Thermosipho sp. (in: thermotogales)]
MPKKLQLKKSAKENTTIKKKNTVTKEEEVIKAGTPLDHIIKKVPNMIGMSKGVTVNMDNYESFRVDCWLTVPLDDKSSPEEKFMELSEIIESQIQYEVQRIIEMNER